MTSEKPSAPELIYYCEFDPEKWGERLEITFSNRHIVTAEFQSMKNRKSQINIDIQSKESVVPQDFFGNNILNVTALAGKNGAGKTTIFKNIHEIKYPIKNIFAGDEKYIIGVYKQSSETFFIKKGKNDIQVQINNFKETQESSHRKSKLFFHNVDGVSENIYLGRGISEVYHLLLGNDILHTEFKRLFPILNKLDITLSVERMNSEKLKRYCSSEEFPINDFLKEMEYKHSNEMFKINLLLTIINCIFGKFFNLVFDREKVIKNISIVMMDVFNRFRSSNDEEFKEILNGSCLQLKKIITSIFSSDEDIKKNLNILLNINTTVMLNEYRLYIVFDNHFCKESYNILQSYEYLQSLSISTVGFSINGFSSGEEAIIFQLSTILKKIKKYCSDKELGSIILLIDEYEDRLHPEWSRVYLSYLIQLLQNILQSNKNTNKIMVQLVISTHSPYLISDLPKENIRLITKNETTGKREVSITKHGFASNYYDILSDSFFLEDTIGEFAKQKINSWISELNQLEKNIDEYKDDKTRLEKIDEIKKLIMIVDDQFLRNKLLELADDIKNKIIKNADSSHRESLIDAEIAKLEAMREQLRAEEKND